MFSVRECLMVVSESVYCQIVFSLMFSVKNCLKDKTPYRMCVCVCVVFPHKLTAVHSIAWKGK